MPVSKYAAFISYSHNDEVVARWLHRRLEAYAIPRGAAPDYGRKGLFGRRIGRVFRDRSGRTFSQAEIDADPLLFSGWNYPTRDVCADVPGVPPLSAEGGRR